MLDPGGVGYNPKHKDPGGGGFHHDPGGGGGHIAISKDPGGTGY